MKHTRSVLHYHSSLQTYATMHPPVNNNVSSSSSTLAPSFAGRPDPEPGPWYEGDCEVSENVQQRLTQSDPLILSVSLNSVPGSTF